MNVVGAAGFVVNGWWHGALPSAVLNVLWLLIGAFASWRIIRKRRIVDLSHVIEHGMTTYPVFRSPHICDFWTRERSAANYDDGSSFHIGQIDGRRKYRNLHRLPFHRYADGNDLADLPLTSLADLPGIVVRLPWREGHRGLTLRHSRGSKSPVERCWSTPAGPHWRTDRYGEAHSFLTAAVADWLVEHGAALVGIDSNNIDDTGVRARPVAQLLGADIPICEHMVGLGQLPDEAFVSPPSRRRSEEWGPFQCALTPCWIERVRP